MGKWMMALIRNRPGKRPASRAASRIETGRAPATARPATRSVRKMTCHSPLVGSAAMAMWGAARGGGIITALL